MTSRLFWYGGMMDFHEQLKSKLQTNLLKPTGETAGGCINEGEVYLTDNGKVFVKKNSKPDARLMFDGEFESLRAILDTKTVCVPKPIVVIDRNLKSGAVLVLEYVKMNSLSKYSAKLGEELAKMHLHNKQIREKSDSQSVHQQDGVKYVSKFGFHCATCCGYIPQDNTWHEDWVTFFAGNKLQQQINMVQSNFGDREAVELWSQLEPKLPLFFRDVTDVTPSLLHGDLWSGNAAETDTNPVIFDPASFYGHSEFDLSISKLFGGFSGSFYSAYHNLIPKEKGYEDRLELYKLFHYLNHWNHFGGGYKGSSLTTLKKLVKKVS